MPWPNTQVAVGDVITAAQLNLLPIQIADTLLLAPAASITFSSIPQVFKHLLLVGKARGDTGSRPQVQVVINADTAAVYDIGHIGLAAASLAGSGQALANGAGIAGWIPAVSDPANAFGPLQGLFTDYATVGMQNALFFGQSRDTATGMYLDLTGNWYKNAAAAITSLKLQLSAGSFIAGTRLTLYGLA